MNLPSSSAEGLIGNPVSEEIILSTQGPQANFGTKYEFFKRFQFGFKFRTAPSPGKDAVIDIRFIQDAVSDFEWEQYRKELTKDGYNDFSNWYYYKHLFRSEIKTAYATLEFDLYCKDLNGQVFDFSRYRIHRLLAPFTSYEIKGSTLSFESYNLDLAGSNTAIQTEISLDDKSQIQYAVPSTCASFWIGFVKTYFWLGMDGVSYYKYNGELYWLDDNDHTYRVRAEGKEWNKQHVNISTFKAKASPTPKSPSPQRTPTQLPKTVSTPSKIIVGQKCSNAGDIKSSSGKKLVCAKSKGKLIWVLINSNSSPNPSSSATSKCVPSSTPVQVSLGSAQHPNHPGFFSQSIKLENLSDCNVIVSLSAGADCETGKIKQKNQYVVPIQTTLSLTKRQKISIFTFAPDYFPNAPLLCQNLTGFESRVYAFATNIDPRVVVLSSK